MRKTKTSSGKPKNRLRSATHLQSAGIDLAGFSTGNTCIVIAQEKGETAYCQILNSHPFSRKRTGNDDLLIAISEEAAFLKSLIEKGRVVVDIPIDLQSLSGIFLPSSQRPKLKTGTPITELYKRKVDQFFEGLSPVADRLAAPVIRFASSMHFLNTRHPRVLKLGENLFETYPKASFEPLLAASCRGYKSGPSYDLKGKVRSIHGPITRALSVLERISYTHGVSFESQGGCEINDHLIDALVCALTGLGSFDGVTVTNRRDLNKYGMTLSRPVPKKLQFPRGHRLIADWPNTIKRVVIEKSEWAQ